MRGVEERDSTPLVVSSHAFTDDIPPSQFESVFLSDAHTDVDIRKTLGAYGLSLKAVKH